MLRRTSVKNRKTEFTIRKTEWRISFCFCFHLLPSDNILKMETISGRLQVRRDNGTDEWPVFLSALILLDGYNTVTTVSGGTCLKAG